MRRQQNARGSQGGEEVVSRGEPRVWWSHCLGAELIHRPVLPHQLPAAVDDQPPKPGQTGALGPMNELRPSRS